MELYGFMKQFLQSAAIFSALALAGSAEQRLNVLMIVVDDLRAELGGAYGSTVTKLNISVACGPS